MKLSLLQYPPLLLLFFILLLLGCKKEEEPRQPEVETQAITLLSPSTVELKGNIINIGKLPVLDYGFVYGPTPDVNGKSGYKISLGKDAKTGVYTQGLTGLESSTSYYTDRTLYVRAYIENQMETKFGELA